MKHNETYQAVAQAEVVALEWVTPKQACSYAQMGLTCLYSHLDFNGGAIKTALVRRRGAIQGKRLINFDSLRSFIESCTHAEIADEETDESKEAVA